MCFKKTHGTVDGTNEMQIWYIDDMHTPQLELGDYRVGACFFFFIFQKCILSPHPNIKVYSGCTSNETTSTVINQKDKLNLECHE